MFKKHRSQIILVEASKHIDPVKKEKFGGHDFELLFSHLIQNTVLPKSFLVESII